MGASLPCETFRCSELVISPKGTSKMWLSVDGEGYEAMTFAVKVLPNAVKFLNICD